MRAPWKAASNWGFGEAAPEGNRWWSAPPRRPTRSPTRNGTGKARPALRSRRRGRRPDRDPERRAGRRQWQRLHQPIETIRTPMPKSASTTKQTMRSGTFPRPNWCSSACPMALPWQQTPRFPTAPSRAAGRPTSPPATAATRTAFDQHPDQRPGARQHLTRSSRLQPARVKVPLAGQVEMEITDTGVITKASGEFIASAGEVGLLDYLAEPLIVDEGSLRADYDPVTGSIVITDRTLLVGSSRAPAER